MLRGFYTAASGMIAQQRQQEAMSNNIANVNTPGYRADRGVLKAFPEMLMERIQSKEIPVKRGLDVAANQRIGSMNTGVYVQEVLPDFSQGDLRETGVSTDFGIMQGNVPDENGSVFFTVEKNGEQRYTRNGNFTVDEQGYLVTNQGYYVLDGNGGRIQTDGMDFTVNDEGIMDLDGRQVPLGLSYVADTNQLAKEGEDMFRGDGVPLPANVQVAVHQGELESSNVDVMSEMTRMMDSYRVYETNQRVLKAYDESMGKAVSEIGRIG